MSDFSRITQAAVEFQKQECEKAIAELMKLTAGELKTDFRFRKFLSQRMFDVLKGSPPDEMPPEKVIDNICLKIERRQAVETEYVMEYVEKARNAPDVKKLRMATTVIDEERKTVRGMVDATCDGYPRFVYSAGEAINNEAQAISDALNTNGAALKLLFSHMEYHLKDAVPGIKMMRGVPLFDAKSIKELTALFDKIGYDVTEKLKDGNERVLVARPQLVRADVVRTKGVRVW